MLFVFLSVILAICLPSFAYKKSIHILLAVGLPLLLLSQFVFIYLFQEENTITSLAYAIPISFSFSHIYLYFCFAMCILWLFASVYSVFYISENYGVKKLAKFMPFYNMAVCASLLIALSSNLVTTFIFYEILTFSTLPLVGFSGGEKAKKGIKKYIIILSCTAILLFLPGIIIIQNTLDTTEFTPHVGTISSMFTQEIAEHNLENYVYIPSSNIMIFAFVMLIFGVAKNGLFPFNGWLPAAMCAPAPVSALLHAVAVVKSGVFITYKIIYELYGPQYIEHLRSVYPLVFSLIALCATAGIVYASICAVSTTDVKRILAFSTISGITYIVLLFLIGTEESLKAGFIQMAFHGITKIGLFFLAGVLYSMYHTNDYTKMAGAFSKHKILFYALVLFVISMMGMPLTAGFVSKQLTMQTLLNSKEYIALFGIALSTVATVIYLAKPLIYIIMPVKSYIVSSNIVNISRYVIMPMIVLNIVYGVYIWFFA